MHTTFLTRFVRFTLAAVCLAVAGVSFGQDTIYRCGNEYTNDANDAKSKGCKVVVGGNVTVIQAPKPTVGNTSRTNANAGTVAGAGTQRVDSSEQRQRDADAKGILESELRKAEQNLAQLRRDYNDGSPEKMAAETKNYQKYLDRVNDLRNQVTRAENDVASIKRELARLGGRTSPTQGGTTP